jgi:hypothetical protein
VCSSDLPVMGKPPRGSRQITIPKRDFVLDPLL